MRAVFSDATGEVIKKAEIQRSHAGEQAVTLAQIQQAFYGGSNPEAAGSFGTCSFRMRCWYYSGEENGDYTWLDVSEEADIHPIPLMYAQRRNAGGNSGQEGRSFIVVQVLDLDRLENEERERSAARAEDWNVETKRLQQMHKELTTRPRLPNLPPQKSTGAFSKSFGAAERRASGTAAANVVQTAKQGMGRLMSMFRGANENR